MTDLLNEYSSKDRDLFQLIVSDEKDLSKPTITGNQIFGASDSDYANKLEESRKSTSGYVFFFRHNLVCWKSKLQPILATSTHEAELIAMNLAAQEAIWLRNFLVEVLKKYACVRSVDTVDTLCRLQLAQLRRAAQDVLMFWWWPTML